MTTITLRDYHDQLNNLFTQESYDEVIGHCHHILRYFPKNINTYRLLGNALLRNRNYDDAIDIFRRILSAEPTDYSAHKGLSEIFEAQRNLDAAIWHIERIYDVWSNNAVVINEIRRLYNLRDSKELDKVQMTHAALAHQYMKAQLYEQAIAELRGALENHPNRHDLRVLLAEALFVGGHVAEAGKMAVQVLKVLPECLPANRLMVNIWLENKRPEDARPFLERIEALAPYEGAAIVAGSEEKVAAALFQLPRLDWQARERAALSTSVPDWMSEFEGETLTTSGTGPLMAGDEPDWYASGADNLAVSSPVSPVDDSIHDWFGQIESDTGSSQAQPAPSMPSLFDDLELPEDLTPLEDEAPEDSYSPAGFTGFLTDLEETRAAQQQEPLSFDESDFAMDEPDWFANLGSMEPESPNMDEQPSEPEFELPDMGDIFADEEMQEILSSSGMTDFLNELTTADEPGMDFDAPELEPLDLPDDMEFSDSFANIGNLPGDLTGVLESDNLDSEESLFAVPTMDDDFDFGELEEMEVPSGMTDLLHEFAGTGHAENTLDLPDPFADISDEPNFSDVPEFDLPEPGVGDFFDPGELEDIEIPLGMTALLKEVSGMSMQENDTDEDEIEIPAGMTDLLKEISVATTNPYQESPESGGTDEEVPGRLTASFSFGEMADEETSEDELEMPATGELFGDFSPAEPEKFETPEYGTTGLTESGVEDLFGTSALDFPSDFDAEDEFAIDDAVSTLEELDNLATLPPSLDMVADLMSSLEGESEPGQFDLDEMPDEDTIGMPTVERGHDLPDWMTDLKPTTQSLASEVQSTESEGDIPDWMLQVGDEDSAGNDWDSDTTFDVDEAEAQPAETAPDWMSDLRFGESEVEAEPVSDTPDWMGGMAFD
ncbi:MAG TPA: tetratricopeptide repeat protein, partial [Aggregatilineales bacterium]|nr:tetratricopeptide repeat protein [Aggregatilineales bacterium]